MSLPSLVDFEEAGREPLLAETEEERRASMFSDGFRASAPVSARINGLFVRRLSRIAKIALDNSWGDALLVLLCAGLSALYGWGTVEAALKAPKIEICGLGGTVACTMGQFAWFYGYFFIFDCLVSGPAQLISYMIGERITCAAQTRLANDTLSRFHKGARLYNVATSTSQHDFDQVLGKDAFEVIAALFGLTTGNFQNILGKTFFQSFFTLFFIESGGKSSSFGVWFPATLIYTAITIVVFTSLTGALSRSYHTLLETQGFLKFFHSRISTFCESIAFFGGESRERAYADAIASQCGVARRRYYGIQRLNQFWNAYLTGGLSQAVLYFVIYLAWPGNYRQIATLYTFFNVALSCLMTIVSFITYLPQLAGATHRVGELLELLDLLDEDAASVDTNLSDIGIRLAGEGEEDIVFANVDLKMPRLDGDNNSAKPRATITEGGIRTQQPHLLLEALSLRVRPGQHLVITGPSGCGKSSILRAIAGLWKVARGTITLPHNRQSPSSPKLEAATMRPALFFVPQRPYLFKSTLRAQVMYPQTSGTRDADKKIEEILRTVDLVYLLDRFSLDHIAAWGSLLSIGEQQRLGFARLFYSAPQYALMDESTSAMDVDLEARCLRSCRDRGVTMISVAHRPTAIGWHVNELHLETSGSAGAEVGRSALSNWTLRPVGDAERNAVVSTESPEASHGANTKRPEISPGGAIAAFAAAEVATTKARGYADFRALLSKEIPSWCGSQKGRLLLWAIFIFFCYIMITLALDFIQFFGGVATTYFEDGNKNGVLTLAFMYGGLSLVQSYLKTYCFKIADRISFDFQDNLLSRIQEMYFRPGVPYKINVLEGQLVSQRINDVLDIGETSCWAFGSNFAFSNPRTGFIFDAFATSIYVLVGLYLNPFLIFVTLCLVVGMVAVQDITAGWVSGILQDASSALVEYKDQLSLMREHAESIVFYKGHVAEATKAAQLALHSRTVQLTANWKSLPRNFVLFILPYVVVYLPAFIILGQIYNSSFADATYPYTPVVSPNGNSTSTLLLISGAVATELVGPTAAALPITIIGLVRLFVLSSNATSFVDSLQKQGSAFDEEIINPVVSNSDVVHDEPENDGNINFIEMKDCKIQTPDGNATILADFSMRIGTANSDSELESIVIMGPSGCGKSSLLRTIAGLWEPSVGSVRRPDTGTGGVFFVPQSSYIALGGSLRDQVSYPDKLGKNLLSDSDSDPILHILSTVGLDYLAERLGLDSVVDWDSILSGGEKQRLGFARLFYRKPNFAVIDEGTSALDVETEARCLQACVDARITMISVAHRPSVLRFHQKVLRLDGKGGASWSKANL